MSESESKHLNTKDEMDLISNLKSGRRSSSKKSSSTRNLRIVAVILTIVIVGLIVLAVFEFTKVDDTKRTQAVVGRMSAKGKVENKIEVSGETIYDTKGIDPSHVEIKKTRENMQRDLNQGSLKLDKIKEANIDNNKIEMNKAEAEVFGEKVSADLMVEYRSDGPMVTANLQDGKNDKHLLRAAGRQTENTDIDPAMLESIGTKESSVLYANKDDGYVKEGLNVKAQLDAESNQELQNLLALQKNSNVLESVCSESANKEKYHKFQAVAVGSLQKENAALTIPDLPDFCFQNNIRLVTTKIVIERRGDYLYYLLSGKLQFETRMLGGTSKKVEMEVKGEISGEDKGDIELVSTKRSLTLSHGFSQNLLLEECVLRAKINMVISNRISGIIDCNLGEGGVLDAFAKKKSGSSTEQAVSFLLSDLVTPGPNDIVHLSIKNRLMVGQQVDLAKLNIVFISDTKSSHVLFSGKGEVSLGSKVVEKLSCGIIGKLMTGNVVTLDAICDCYDHEKVGIRIEKGIISFSTSGPNSYKNAFLGKVKIKMLHFKNLPEFKVKHKVEHKCNDSTKCLVIHIDTSEDTLSAISKEIPAIESHNGFMETSKSLVTAHINAMVASKAIPMDVGMDIIFTSGLAEFYSSLGKAKLNDIEAKKVVLSLSKNESQDRSYILFNFEGPISLKDIQLGMKVVNPGEEISGSSYFEFPLNNVDLKIGAVGTEGRDLVKGVMVESSSVPGTNFFKQLNLKALNEHLFCLKAVFASSQMRENAESQKLNKFILHTRDTVQILKESSISTMEMVLGEKESSSVQHLPEVTLNFDTEDLSFSGIVFQGEYTTGIMPVLNLSTSSIVDLKDGKVINMKLRIFEDMVNKSEPTFSFSGFKVGLDGTTTEPWGYTWPKTLGGGDVPLPSCPGKLIVLPDINLPVITISGVKVSFENKCGVGQVKLNVFGKIYTLAGTIGTDGETIKFNSNILLKEKLPATIGIVKAEADVVEKKHIDLKSLKLDIKFELNLMETKVLARYSNFENPNDIGQAFLLVENMSIAQGAILIQNFKISKGKANEWRGNFSGLFLEKISLNFDGAYTPETKTWSFMASVINIKEFLDNSPEITGQLNDSKLPFTNPSNNLTLNVISSEREGLHVFLTAKTVLRGVSFDVEFNFNIKSGKFLVTMPSLKIGDIVELSDISFANKKYRGMLTAGNCKDSSPVFCIKDLSVDVEVQEKDFTVKASLESLELKIASKKVVINDVQVEVEKKNGKLEKFLLTGSSEFCSGEEGKKVKSDFRIRISEDGEIISIKMNINDEDADLSTALVSSGVLSASKTGEVIKTLPKIDMMSKKEGSQKNHLQVKYEHDRSDGSLSASLDAKLGPLIVKAAGDIDPDASDNEKKFALLVTCDSTKFSSIFGSEMDFKIDHIKISVTNSSEFAKLSKMEIEKENTVLFQAKVALTDIASQINLPSIGTKGGTSDSSLPTSLEINGEALLLSSEGYSFWINLNNIPLMTHLYFSALVELRKSENTYKFSLTSRIFVGDDDGMHTNSIGVNYTANENMINITSLKDESNLILYGRSGAKVLSLTNVDIDIAFNLENKKFEKSVFKCNLLLPGKSINLDVALVFPQPNEEYLTFDVVFDYSKHQTNLSLNDMIEGIASGEENLAKDYSLIKSEKFAESLVVGIRISVYFKPDTSVLIQIATSKAVERTQFDLSTMVCVRRNSSKTAFSVIFHLEMSHYTLREGGDGVDNLSTESSHTGEALPSFMKNISSEIDVDDATLVISRDLDATDYERIGSYINSANKSFLNVIGSDHDPKLAPTRDRVFGMSDFFFSLNGKFKRNTGPLVLDTNLKAWGFVTEGFFDLYASINNSTFASGSTGVSISLKKAMLYLKLPIKADVNALKETSVCELIVDADVNTPGNQPQEFSGFFSLKEEAINIDLKATGKWNILAQLYVTEPRVLLNYDFSDGSKKQISEKDADTDNYDDADEEEDSGQKDNLLVLNKTSNVIDVEGYFDMQFIQQGIGPESSGAVQRVILNRVTSKGLFVKLYLDFTREFPNNLLFFLELQDSDPKKLIADFSKQEETPKTPKVDETLQSEDGDEENKGSEKHLPVPQNKKSKSGLMHKFFDKLYSSISIDEFYLVLNKFDKTVRVGKLIFEPGVDFRVEGLSILNRLKGSASYSHHGDNFRFYCRIKPLRVKMGDVTIFTLRGCGDREADFTLLVSHQNKKDDFEMSAGIYFFGEMIGGEAVIKLVDQDDKLHTWSINGEWALALKFRATGNIKGKSLLAPSQINLELNATRDSFNDLREEAISSVKTAQKNLSKNLKETFTVINNLDEYEGRMKKLIEENRQDINDIVQSEQHDKDVQQIFEL